MLIESMNRKTVEHNEEVKEVWDAFWAGKPIRVPMTLGISVRYFMPIADANPKKCNFERYINDPDIMMELQLSSQFWARHNIHYCFDIEAGLPTEHWPIYVDFQNFYEAAWFGAEVYFPEGQVPDTRPFITDENKNILFDRGIPDPLNYGIMKKAREYYEYWRKKIKNFIFHGKPVKITGISGLCTDGPLTVAANLRGADIFTDFYIDPEFAHKLLNYITDASIVRIKAWKEYLKEDFPQNWWDAEQSEDKWGFGDDSVELISEEIYEEFVLPCHKKLIETFGSKGPNFIHLCGDASRHFKKMRDELDIKTFDTGFPIDLGEMRKELGPDVTFYGGPQIQLLKEGPIEEIVAETKRILNSGVMEGGKFVLREANNLAPLTPLSHLDAMYQTCRQFGGYEK